MRSFQDSQSGPSESFGVLGLLVNGFGTGQQVAATDVEISLKSRTFEVVVQVAGIG